MPPTFLCCMRDTEGLAAVLELVAAEFNKEHVLMRLFQDRGLQIQCIDQSQSSFLDAFFTTRGGKSVFSKFACAEEVHSLWVDPGLCSKALRAAGPFAMLSGTTKLRTDVHMSLARGGDRLEFEFDAISASGVRKRSKHSIALFDPSIQGDEAEVDATAFSFTAEVYIDTPMLLHEVVAQLKAAGCEELSLRVAGSAVTFATASCSGGMMEASVQIYPDGGVAIACEAEYHASYAFRYFVRLAKLVKSSSRLLLQMGEGAPLGALVDLTGGGSCQVFLAPLVDEEEGGEGHAGTGGVGTNEKEGAG